MSRFDFTLSYKAGSTNHSDALSRHPDLSEGVESDNKAQILLPANLFNKSDETLVEPSPTRHIKSTEIASSDLISLIRLSKSEHDALTRVALAKLLRVGPQGMRGLLGHWTHEDGITRRNGHICVPKDDLIRRTIIKMHHDTMAAGHPGKAKTLELVQQHYWWQNMTKFVHKYVDRCAICQSTKNLTHQTRPPIYPLETTNVPWCFISMDFITDLPKSKGYDSINVAVD